MRVSVTRVVPLGLIVNEAVCNAAKYAYGDGNGPVEVSLACDPELQEGCIEVRDHGCGMQEKPNIGTGTSLIEALARQIGATVERVSSSEGTMVKVVFPLSS